MTFTKSTTRLAAITITALSLAAAPAFAGTHSSKKADCETTSTMKKADIVDTAVSAGSFNTLVAAVQAAGLESTLRSDGPFTVFAPTDAAFAKLPAGTVEMLLKPENKDTLASILTYHVLAGKVKSKDLKGKTLKTATVEGSKVFVDGRHGVKVDAAKVIKADIKTTNGIIHVIDTVIMP